jgi:hypothetical protein
LARVASLDALTRSTKGLLESSLLRLPSLASRHRLRSGRMAILVSVSLQRLCPDLKRKREATYRRAGATAERGCGFRVGLRPATDARQGGQIRRPSLSPTRQLGRSATAACGCNVVATTCGDLDAGDPYAR